MRRGDERGLAPLRDPLTPHSLRRTFARVLYALGEDPGVCMDELGHTDPRLALRVYRQLMRRDESCGRVGDRTTAGVSRKWSGRPK
jgi:integrase